MDGPLGFGAHDVLLGVLDEAHAVFLDEDVPLPSREELLKLVANRPGPTPEMTACKKAADQVFDAIEADEDLRQRFAAKGVEHLNVTPAFTDPDWCPSFTSPRFTFKPRKKYLDVDCWYIYEGPVEPEAFGTWVHEKVTADLEAWLAGQ